MSYERHTLVPGDPTVDLGPAVASDARSGGSREWLVTNGIGGYAAGTVTGVPTRRYHGLLVAALQPPLGRTLLAAGVMEGVDYDGSRAELGAARWQSRRGPIAPDGYRHLRRFHLDGTTPTWTYALGDALLEKQVWMEPGVNTTYLRYRLVRGSAPLRLQVKVLADHRDHHATTRAGERSLEVELLSPSAVRVAGGSTPLYLLSDRARAEVRGEWYRSFFLEREADRGLDATTDAFHAADFTVTLVAGRGVVIAAGTDPAPDLDGEAARERRRSSERHLLDLAGLASEPGWIRQLVLAADQFVVRRPVGGDPDGRTVIAGYPWFGDWGRDTMISLPGLALATGRLELAERILTGWAGFVDRGMLPNRFPEDGMAPEYNTVDATLWFIEAVRATLAAGASPGLASRLYPVVAEIVERHVAGTRHGIVVDPEDGLLVAGEEGVQLTWMDAKVGDWVVTPRIGKPVEVNALWHNALRVASGLAAAAGESPDRYDRLALAARKGFARFWDPARGYCYDVIDGPEGDDPSLRPNQLIAVSLEHSPLEPEQRRGVVEACGRHLLTPIGLRSLAAAEPAYVGSYGGSIRRRDGAYHQGTVWSWLIGPYAAAHLRVFGDHAAVRALLDPFRFHLAEAGLGSVSEIADGDPPHLPRGAFAQAWGVAEVLRVWRLAGSGG